MLWPGCCWNTSGRPSAHPPRPRTAVNYLDLSKLGEEGETPASDEIWLAVDEDEGEVDKRFLSSCSSGTQSITSSIVVETDKHSATANVLMDDTEHENLVASKLHGVIAEELLPIQDTLHVTEKNMKDLTDKFFKMETVLDEMLVSIGQLQQKSASLQGSKDDERLEDIMTKIEMLSQQMVSVDNIKQLRKDNDHLREDLDSYRGREKRYLERIEAMEAKVQQLQSVPANSRVSTSRSESGESVSSREFPPIASSSVPNRTKRSAASKEDLVVEETIEPLSTTNLASNKDSSSRLPKRTRKVLHKRGIGNNASRPEKIQLSQDCLQTEMQIARSDNIILRQDLQIFRERESQLMRRNRELEETLLKPKFKDQSKSSPIDANAEKHVVALKNAASSTSLIEMVDSSTLTSAQQEPLISSAPQPNSNKNDDDLPNLDAKKESIDSCLGDKNEPSEELKASWEVTITSKDEMELQEKSPKKIKVTPKSTAKPPQADAPLPPPKPHPKPVKEVVIQEKVPKQKVKQPPRVEKKANKPRPAPKSIPAPSIQPPTPTQPLPQPAESSHTRINLLDARSDPIPKPAQFPVARPPRDYKPGKIPVKKRTSAADLIRQDNIFDGTDNDNNNQSNSKESSGEVIQMVIKEEVKEVGLEGGLQVFYKTS